MIMAWWIAGANPRLVTAFAKEAADIGIEGIVGGSEIKDLFRYFLKARLRAALPRFYRSLRRLRSLPLRDRRKQPPVQH